MSVEITYCSTCAEEFPDFLEFLTELQVTHTDSLVVVDFQCMASCDIFPTVFVDEDYLPQISLPKLEREITERLNTLALAEG